MHEKVLPRGSRTLLNRLEKLRAPALSGWTLAGETGLALHLGHRQSEDFDFFRTDDESLDELRRVVSAVEPFEVLLEAVHTLTILIAGVKLSFFRVEDPFLYETHPYRFFSVADPQDIALMKLAAISSRGSRKDFVDLYTVLRIGPKLQELFWKIPEKYGKGRANTYHILKSLTYFEDAEREPLPVMLEPFDWDQCKAFFVREAHAIVL